MAAADAVSLIERDHREMEALFERVKAGNGDRAALLGEITTRLTAHARAEEQEVYPQARRTGPGDAEVGHAYDEHHEAEHLLRSARNLAASPHFDEAFAAFVAAVSHHVEEEEQELLPALRDAVDAGTLRRLGTAFDKTRTALVAESTKSVKTSRGTAGKATTRAGKSANQPAAKGSKRPAKRGAAAPPADATRDELYELARRADIPGRSSMTKDQLAEALRGR
jgi:hemerythrin superfamily protein